MPQGALLSCFFCPFRVALVILTCLVSFGLAQNEKILYNFEAFPQGATPMSNLIADAAGNLYGTTYFGGPYQGGLGVGLNGSGTVFELSPASEGKWTEKVLYRFTGGNDGANPAAGLVFDTAGNLYGVTGQTAFKLSPLPQGEWTESTIHTFTGYPNDGIGADRSLIFDNAGNLYGTTFRGGTYDSGIIFELSPGSGGSWTETILYNFSNGQDGANPAAGLIFDSAGDLYGTTEGGGDANCENEGCGVVFELSPKAMARGRRPSCTASLIPTALILRASLCLIRQETCTARPKWVLALVAAIPAAVLCSACTLPQAVGYTRSSTLSRVAWTELTRWPVLSFTPAGFTGLPRRGAAPAPNICALAGPSLN